MGEPTQPGNADQFLVEQISQGDQSAWRQLIDRFSGRLLAFARARTTSFSDAEDLVQETFVGFRQSLAHFDRARSLETYLFTILRYKLYDLLRQRKTNVISEPPEAEDWWDRIDPGSSETPSGVALLAEATDQQEQLLTELLRQLIHELRDRNAFRSSLERILEWPFDRIVVAHGEVSETGGREQLMHGYSWLLDQREESK